MEDTISRKSIDRVMQEHVSSLMAISGVAGVAIGEGSDGEPCILVLIVERREELLRRIPRSLDGYPVKIEVSGKIEPL